MEFDLYHLYRCRHVRWSQIKFSWQQSYVQMRNISLHDISRRKKLECGPMPKFNTAVWLTPTTWLSCSNAAKTRKPLTLAGVPQTAKWSQPLVDPSSPYCGDIWRRYYCLKSFFPNVDTCLSCEDIARQSCATVPRWRFLATFFDPAFPASRVQHVSDLHPKFALRPHHVWKYGRHPICDGWD